MFGLKKKWLVSALSVLCVWPQVLELLLDLRADSYNRLGLPDKSKPSHLSYSPYVLCSYR